MKQFCVASLAVAAMLATGCNKSHDNAAGAGATAGTSGRADTHVSSGDRDFVKDVSSMNAAEIDLSRLATERASSPDVKSFAQMMITDHTAAGAQLSGVAVQNSIDAPATMDDAHRGTHDDLAKKSGLDFDRDYVDAMVDGHQKLVDKLESRIDRDTLSQYKATADQKATDKTPKVEVKTQLVTPEKSDDPVTQRINAWAADTYPTAYGHLRAVKDLRDTLKKRSTD
jgi:putative membrane protein